MEKLVAAAITMMRGSHLLASRSSSAKWQMLSALVRVVTGAIMPASRQQCSTNTCKGDRTDENCSACLWPFIRVLPVVEDLITTRAGSHESQNEHEGEESSKVCTCQHPTYVSKGGRVTKDEHDELQVWQQPD